MRAKELIFTARKITAVEAFEYGILTKVVAKEEVLITAFSLATQIANNGPIAIQQAKFAINQGMNTDLKTGLEIEGKAYEGTIQTNDRLEALRAFQEKLKPKFSGDLNVNGTELFGPFFFLEFYSKSYHLVKFV